MPCQDFVVFEKLNWKARSLQPRSNEGYLWATRESAESVLHVFQGLQLPRHQTEERYETYHKKFLFRGGNLDLK